ELIKQLGDDDGRTREKAQAALEEIGEPAEAALKKATKSSDAEVRMRATLALKLIPIKKLGTFSETFLQKYSDICQSLPRLDANGRFKVLYQIAGRPVTNKDVFIYDSSMFEKCDGAVRKEDLATLIGLVLADGGKGLTTRQKLDLLELSTGGSFWGLDSDKRSVWRYNDIHEAGPHLVKLLEDDEPYIRRAALSALTSLRTREAIPGIIRQLKEKDNWIRLEAIEALDDLGAKEAIPELTKLLEDDHEPVRTQ
ncbi:unnamed protein product, partial [marine sediment metagenome]